ncbi:gto2, partial [Symbiodinium pilosum]
YHLYINYTCGWSVVSISATANYFWGGGLGSDDYSGWAFDEENPDPVLNAKHTRDIYLTDSPDYGRRQLSVPILFDKKTRKIVSNDNIQIGYILNSCLNELLDEEGRNQELYPEALRPQIDELNALIYPNINDGVYRVAFAKEPELKEQMRQNVFKALAEVEAILAKSKEKAKAEAREKFNLVADSGDSLSLADVRAFPHLIRFDTCYFTAFKCNVRRLSSGEYPHIMEWLERMYTMPEVKQTCKIYLACMGYNRDHGDGAGERAWKEERYDWLEC